MFRIYTVSIIMALCALLFSSPLSASARAEAVSGLLSALEDRGDTASVATSVRNDFSIYYYRDRINVDPEYLDNRDNLEKIRTYLALSPKIDSIVIYAYASPEGVYERNVWLSRKRAEAAKRYIIENLPENSRLKEEDILLRPMAENWGGAAK